MTSIAPWCLRLDTPHRTVRLEIPAGEDYLIVTADQDPHPDDWTAILEAVTRLCHHSRYALGIPEYDGRYDLWTAVYETAALRDMLGWP